MELSEIQARTAELERQISNLPAGSITKKTVNGKDYFYAVQVASSVKRITDFRYLKLREKVKELKGDGRYRYYVGVTKNYQQVLEFQRNVRKKIKDCFIIAVSNGKLIPVSEARKLEAKK